MFRMFMNHGIDIRREPILVFPTLHYQNGGLDINVDGMTPNVPNLYVAGEAVGGIHGRNRLMGNSLLDIIVFGRNAGQNAAARAKDVTVGALTLTASADAITGVRFGAQGARDASALLDAAEAQLHEYFARTRRTFDLPLDPRGTAFELRVWAALCTIPYGETRSYGTIAAAIGSPRAARAVGMANHRNPLPILIPCHRVIGADGSLTGYAGGLETKRRLLALEGITHLK